VVRMTINYSCMRMTKLTTLTLLDLRLILRDEENRGQSRTDRSLKCGISSSDDDIETLQLVIQYKNQLPSVPKGASY
jgi:hypothetical protein